MRALLLAGTLAFAGCATIAEGRVEQAMLNAGLSPAMSACMADRMTERLSIPQLGRLEELRRPSATAREASLADYLDRVRRVGDAEVISVTTSSAAICASGLDR